MKVVGHQGAKGLAPENTLTSVLKALECDVDEIEIDVRVTSDGIPVLYHYTKLRREHGQPLTIADHTLDQLRAAWPDLATLEEAIRNVDRQVTLLVEVKRGVRVAPVTTVLKGFLREGWKLRDFALASFSQKTLRELKLALPGVRLVVLQSWSGVMASLRARRLHTKYVGMNQRFLWSYFIKSMKRSEYKLYAYTLDDPRKARRLVQYGLHAAITDFPDRFRPQSALAQAEGRVLLPESAQIETPPSSASTKRSRQRPPDTAQR